MMAPSRCCAAPAALRATSMPSRWRLLSRSIGLKAVFGVGAHFVLYRPVSSERAKSSFRAARALMKSERRRNVRVAVQTPVVLRSPEAGGNMKVTTIDLSEGGMAVAVPNQQRPTGKLADCIHASGHFGRSSRSQQSLLGRVPANKRGCGLCRPHPKRRAVLREWLKQNSPEAEQDDPPIRCQLTDLSLGGCYLEMASPFPASSLVTLSMRAGGVEVRAQGVVRVDASGQRHGGRVHPGDNSEHRAAVEKFLGDAHRESARCCRNYSWNRMGWNRNRV
jgi:hypothetical protein